MSSRLSKAIILGLLVGIVGVIASLLPSWHTLDEDFGLGLLFKMRGKKPKPTDVFIVSIDKESSEKLNLPENPDKWPRSFHAQLVENLMREGAKVIAFDVHFIEPRAAQDDNLFAKAIQKAGNVVLCEPLKAKEVQLSDKENSPDDVMSIVKIIKPIELFSDPAAATAPFVLPRIPFKVNQYWTFQTGAGDSPTVPVVVFQLFNLDLYKDFVHLLEKASPNQAGKLPPDAGEAIKTRNVKGLIRQVREMFENEPLLGGRTLKELENSNSSPADEKRHQMLKSLINMYQGPSRQYINYYGPPRSIPTLPYYQALQLRDGKVGDKKIDLKDKAVFVGLSEVLLAERKDSFYTVFSQANGVFIGGVEIAATAFSNLMQDKPLRQQSLLLLIILILIWGTLLGVICRIFPMVISALTVVGLSIGYLFLAHYQFKSTDTWYPIVTPLLLQTPIAFFGGLIWNYGDVNKERQNIKKALGYHLPREVVEQIAKDIVQVETAAQVVYGICLFTDVEQYTTLSETLDPMDLGRLMNRYYETMFKPVKTNGGYVSGVIGDSMLALWATTSSEEAAKEKACSAAIDIQKELKVFFESSEYPNLKTRIGMHCGHILLGHIGALDHYEYTPMGDIVNTASRIEYLNKSLSTRLLLSEEMVTQLNGFLTREVGKFRMAGKVKPVVVHELLGQKEEVEEKVRSACVIFAEALGAFKRQSWDEAREKFSESFKRLGEDGPSSFYMKLCEEYKQNPPGEQWDGVVRMDKK
ncbi:MAG: CHASE2 domain-containing protein [Thermodesulfobacteriota bacterium]